MPQKSQPIHQHTTLPAVNPTQKLEVTPSTGEVTATASPTPGEPERNGLANGSVKHDLEGKDDTKVLKKPSVETSSVTEASQKQDPPSVPSVVVPALSMTLGAPAPPRPVAEATQAPVFSPVAGTSAAPPAAEPNITEAKTSAPPESTPDAKEVTPAALPKVEVPPVATTSGTATPAAATTASPKPPAPASGGESAQPDSTAPKFSSNVTNAETDFKNDDDDDDEEAEKKNEPVEPPLRKVEEDENYDDE